MGSWLTDGQDDNAPVDSGLDWSVFEGAGRLDFLGSLSEAEAADSESLQRVTRVAANASGSRYAQVSLIGTSQFVPAAHGLTYGEDEQHTPVSESLCSVTMASGGVLRVDDARSHTWTSHLPPVTSGKVASYLGVPICDPDGRPIGALCVFDSEPRSWRDEDEALLYDLTQLVTKELHLLAALETVTVSEIRLRSVIRDLVNCPKSGSGSALRARAHYSYPSGAPAGGDWIDWIELPDRIAFSIGDVAGHGIASILVMEELRHALRAYAIDSVGPTDAIVKTSELLRQVRPGEMATAIKADFNPATGLTRFAVAGHPPPIHLRDGRATLLPVQPGPPLGVLTTAPAVTGIVLEPGDRLLMYTDGVFERANEPIDAGLQRLLVAMERHAATSEIEQAARDIISENVVDQRDDACLLLIERPRQPPEPTVPVPARGAKIQA